MQSSHGRHGVDETLARQQPGVRRALNRRLQRAQRSGVERLRAFGRARDAPFGRGRGHLHARQHALRRAQVRPVRDQQAAADHHPRRIRERRRDALPQRERTPAERGDGRLRVVQLGQRAQHARSRERRRRGHVGIGRLAARHGLLADRRIEHRDPVAGARQLPGQQAPQQARASDADVRRRRHHHYGLDSCSRLPIQRWRLKSLQALWIGT